MTAKNLLQKMGFNVDKKATFEINGESFTFEFDRSIYDNFLNEASADNKLTPIKNFLMLSAVPEDKEKLAEILEVPTLPILLMDELQKHFVPKINITLKNSQSV